MEQENDSLTLYFDSVIENFQNLTEEDKNVLREMEGTPQAEVLRKVLGPEVGSTFQLAAPASETDRMLELQEPQDETERMLMASPTEEQPDMPV